jgi:hypothetical protein
VDGIACIRAGKRPRDDGFINAMWQQLLNEARTLEESKKYNEAYQLYFDLAESFQRAARRCGD